MADLVKTFDAFGDFAAMRDAEEFLGAAGFSVGSAQRGAPRGIMFDDSIISKWRNLRDEERAGMHGQLTGDMRNGLVVVRIFEHAPPEAKRAFHQIALARA